MDFDKLFPIVKQVESGGNPNAVSSKGARGLMQTMPGTLRDPGFGVRPAKDESPAELERVGQDYLKAMYAKYGNLKDTLAAYNWGPGNVDKWQASGADEAKLPAETRNYITKITGAFGQQPTAREVDNALATPPSRNEYNRMITAGVTARFLRPSEFGADSAQRGREADRAAREATEAARPSTLEEFGAAFAGSGMVRLYEGITERLFSDEFQAVPGYKADIAALPPTADADLIVEYGTATSPQAAEKALRKFEEEQFRVKTLMDDGASKGIALSFAAELTGVQNWVVPFGVSKALGAAGAASIRGQVAENLLSGTAVEAATQALEGKFRPQDLAISLAADGLIGVGIGVANARAASHAEASRIMGQAQAEAVQTETRLAAQAEKELGPLASADDLAKQMDVIRAREVHTAVTEPVAATSKVLAVDDDASIGRVPREQQTAPAEATATLTREAPDTPAFREWFGNSAAVDEAGKPVIVYHGTNADFEAFSKGALGSNTGATSAREGFFFAGNPATTAAYVKQADNTAPNVIPVYLSMQNPKVYDQLGNAERRRSYAGLLRQAKQEGRDGLIIKNTTDGGPMDTIYVVFDEIQIKSAIGNTGDFNPRDKRINAALANPDSGVHVYTPEELASLRTGGDVLDAVADRELADVLNELPALRAVGVRHVKAGDKGLDPEVIQAFNAGAQGVAALPKDGTPTVFLRSDLTKGLSKDVPVHEVLHAATQAALGRTPALRKELETVASLFGFAMKRATTTSSNVRTELAAAADFFAAVTKKDADELLAYGLTSPTMKRLLEQITWSGEIVGTPMAAARDRVRATAPRPVKEQRPAELTLWDRVVDFFNRLLGRGTRADALNAKLSAYLDKQSTYEKELAEFNTYRMSSDRLKAALRVLIDDAKANGIAGAESQTSSAVSAKPGEVVDDILADPAAVKYGLNLAPVATAADRAKVQAMLALHKKAEAWAVANPMDERYLKAVQNLADNSVFNVASTGLLMLKSPSPLVRMIASELLEDASGVQGKRRATAAISKWTVERLMMGNALNDVQGAYAFWKKDKPGGFKDDMVGGFRWAAFNKEIAAEIETRRVGGAGTSDPNVKAAADSLQAAYQRIANEQRRVGTLGSEGLALSSRGYMPHRMNAKAVLALSNAKKQVVHNALVDQFITIEGWDASFSDMLASKYMQRVQARASGDYGSTIGGGNTSTASLVEEALRSMDLPADVIDNHMKSYAKGAANFTKSRTDLDLLRTYSTPDGEFRLLDIFDTDQTALLRAQAGRASGEVALTKFGVQGKPGLQLLRDAMQYGADGARAANPEREAFDQIAAEFMNEPFVPGGGKQTSGKWMERAMSANTLVRLGGVGFNQLAESINAIFHIGAANAAATVAAIPRLRAEITALARGEKVDNAFLTSIEHTSGAEFGTDAYKVVMPFDSPDHAYPTYGQDTLTVTDRLLRGGTHAQAMLSGWRLIHSAQQRGMAEQIVKKIARYVKEGKDDVALQQFGIGPELRAKIKADLPNVSKFDEYGNPMGFDVTKITDEAAREELIQAVWRGTAQIIQGTFIGERGKWAHDGWLKMLTQFRTFSITSMEKQWGRQRNSHGSFAAFGMLVGSMSLAVPIYMARVYANSTGRPDQEAYIEERLQPQHLARATLNYVALSGMAGDFLDLTTALLPESMGMAPTGGRTGVESTFVGNYVAPSLSLVDDIWKYAQSPDELDEAMKLLPGSRIPYLLPFVNATKD